MSNNIKGKVNVITGVSSGMGEAAARHLAQQGAKVVLGARRMDRLHAVVSEISAVAHDQPSSIIGTPPAEEGHVTVNQMYVGIMEPQAATGMPELMAPAAPRDVQASRVRGHQDPPVDIPSQNEIRQEHLAEATT